MKQVYLFVLFIFAAASGAPGQERLPVIKADVMSAFVWGEDSPTGAVSSTIKDPLTGNIIHTLRYGDIEVSSRLGFERVGSNKVGTFLNYTSTIINGTDSPLSVRYGGISVDGHGAAPLFVVPPGKKLNKKERRNRSDAVELDNMHCFTSGFLPRDNFFSANAPTRSLTLAPGTSVTVSSVIRDPRNYHAMLCSVYGCYPTGTIRYYLRVNDKDYVFVWPGQSAVYCGN